MGLWKTVAIVTGLVGVRAMAFVPAVSADCAELPPRPPSVARALASCIGCHDVAGAGPRTLEAVDRALCRRSPALVERMIERGAAAPAGIGVSAAAAEALRARQRELHADRPRELERRKPKLRLAEHGGLGYLPLGDRTDPGGFLLELLKSRGPIFYDGASLPKARQAQPPGAPMAVEDLFKVVFPRIDTRTGNRYADRGGLEFPWEKCAGTDLAPTVRAFTFFVPPLEGPMVETFRVDRKHREMYSDIVNEDDRLHGFTFLPGTAFVQVLAVPNPETGATLPFEVRIRAVDAEGAWFFDVLRPFPTRTDLATALHVRFPTERRSEAVAKLLEETEAPTAARLSVSTLAQRLPAFWLARNSRSADALADRALVHRLPPLDPETWTELLDGAPFRSAMGLPWVELPVGDARSVTGYAPESDEPVHIAPKGYLGAHVRPASSQCVRCHADTQYSVRRFSPPMGTLVTAGSASAREWFGHLPGSTPQTSPDGLPPAGIFSFHPFARDSLNESALATKPVRLDRRLLDAGLLRETDTQR
jgi:cytochrome c553